MIEEIPVHNNGDLVIEKLIDLIDNNTAIISIMWANNEIGNIYPVEKIAKLAKSNNVIFHTDAVQAIGKIPIDLKKSDIDMLSISGHKLHAPKGIGVLYVKKTLKFNPYIMGGHQEFNNRSGTENVAGIVAIGKAMEIAKEFMKKENIYIKQMRDYLESSIIKRISNVRVNGNINNRLSNISNISFKFIEGEAILILLDKYKIAASSGSACTSGDLSPSHVLKAIKIPKEFLNGTIRFSLSKFNTIEEIKIVVDKLTLIVEKLRKLSPYIIR